MTLHLPTFLLQKFFSANEKWKKKIPMNIGFHNPIIRQILKHFAVSFHQA